MPKFSGGHWIADSTRRAILFRDQCKCVYCGRPAECLDHIHPKDKSSAKTENIVSACAECNNKKGSKTLEVFLSGFSCQRLTEAQARLERRYLPVTRKHRREAMSRWPIWLRMGSDPLLRSVAFEFVDSPEGIPF